MTPRPVYYRAVYQVPDPKGHEFARVVLELPPLMKPDPVARAMVTYLDTLRELLVDGSFSTSDVVASLSRVLRGQAVAGAVSDGMRALA